MQIFASTTSIGYGRTNLADVLPVILALGFDGIELGSTHLWRSDLADVVFSNRPTRIFTHNYFPPARADLVINIASRDPAERAASLSHVRTCIDFAARLGAELYTVHPGFMAAKAVPATSRQPDAAFDFSFVGGNANHEESFLLMRDALRELLDYARLAGVKLAIETEGSITKQGILLMETADEYRRLFAELGSDLWLNFNLAHSSLAASAHGFDLSEFIAEFREHFAAIEISHNDGRQDQHQPLVSNSYVFQWLHMLPDVPMILEFREATSDALRDSLEMLRVWEAEMLLQKAG